MRYLTHFLALSALSAGLVPFASAQATEAAQASAAPVVPSLNQAPAPDEFRWSIGGSEALLWGYNGISGVTSTSDVNATASYVSGNQLHPTSFLYSGGYLFSDSSSQPSGSYQNFGISQQFLSKHYGVVFGDTVSYLPNAPVFGLSGVPGVGDIGTQPIGTGGLPVDSILTDFGRRVTNTASGSVTFKISPATFVDTFGAYTIQRFIDDTGIDNDEIDAGANLNHRIDVKNSVGAGYVFSRFTYKDNAALFFVTPNFTITTNSVNGQFQHVFTRRLQMNLSAGPQWITSSNTSTVPTRVNLAANASLFYLAKGTQYLLAYTRGTSTGGGVLVGTLSDNVNFTVDHTFSRAWHGAFSADYGHAQSLVVVTGQHSNASSAYVGVQATRQFGRFWSAYASYNLEWQSLNGPLLAFNAFSGQANVVGFGVNFSPRPYHIHH